MDLMQAALLRHSVRQYVDRPIEDDKKAVLISAVKDVCAESGLHVELFTEEPEAFKAGKPNYGSFVGCRNYFALAGRKGDDEKVGYYGEKLVLTAQTLGLNTCWVALTYEKDKVPMTLAEGEKLHDVIALGYGATQGVPHKNKDISKVAKFTPDTPDWFRAGMDAVMLAPTAINQQRFYFSIENGKVKAKALLGPCCKTDLGIVKYHFELGAGKENFEWAQ